MSLFTRIVWNRGTFLDKGDGTKYACRFGTAPAPDGDWLLQDGTATGEANDVFVGAFTVGPGDTLEIDLKGGNGETNPFGTPLAFTAVKSVELFVTTAPAAGVSLELGPQGLTNAAQLWFKAATANFSIEVFDRFANQDRSRGWAVDNTHKVVGVKNPGADDVDGWIRVIGTK